MRWKIDLPVDAADEIDRGFDEPVDEFRILRRQSGPRLHLLEKPGFVRAVADDLRIADRLQLTHAIFPHLAFIIQSIGPERALHLFAARWEPKPNEVVEVPVGHSFNVEENRGAVERLRWGSDDM